MARKQPENPTFHEFASRWVADNERSWRPSTRLNYKWQLSNHLLPFFAGHHLAKITIAEVDRYKHAKVREGVLSATSINKTITRLAQILEVAVEHEIIDRNPAKGKPARNLLTAIFEDAAERELTSLRWRDVDLAAGWLRVRRDTIETALANSSDSCSDAEGGE